MSVSINYNFLEIHKIADLWTLMGEKIYMYTLLLGDKYKEMTGMPGNGENDRLGF